MAKSTKKRYKVISSFNYKGADGRSKKSVRIGPGEETPKLDSNELARLLAMEKVAEVSSTTGEIIRTDRAIALNPEQINKFLLKGPNAVAHMLKTNNFSTETLGQMVLQAERNGLPKVVIDVIEAQLNARVATI